MAPVNVFWAREYPVIDAAKDAEVSERMAILVGIGMSAHKYIYLHPLSLEALESSYKLMNHCFAINPR